MSSPKNHVRDVVIQASVFTVSTTRTTAELEGMTLDGEEWTATSEGTPFLPTPEQKREIMAYFSISPDELAIVGEEELAALVCERVVLLAINK